MQGNVKKVEKRDGYELRTVQLDDPSMEMVAAFTPGGHYIGDESDAKFLIGRGIKPELRTADSGTCSIGFCEREQKWYGWSHRAIAGYGIGDVAEEGDGCTESGFTPEYSAEHPEEVIAVPVGFKAVTLEDAKRMAAAFAESVS